MFDISWTEFLLIGVVALIVIGPKELPGVMRTLGQYTRKVRSMAADFQNQFHEAMREAEMADLKKEVDDIAGGIKNYDPLKDVRADIEAMGKDFEKSLEAAPAPQPALDKAAEQQPLAPPAVEPAAPEHGGPEPTASTEAAAPIDIAPPPEGDIAAAEPGTERAG